MDKDMELNKLDVHYHRKNLSKLVDELESYTPEEYRRFLNTMIKVSYPVNDRYIPKPTEQIDMSVPGFPKDPKYTYCSVQSTKCAGCGKEEHTPLRRDEMGGYVCLTCIDKELDKKETEQIDQGGVESFVNLHSMIKLMRTSFSELNINDEDFDVSWTEYEAEELGRYVFEKLKSKSIHTLQKSRPESKGV